MWTPADFQRIRPNAAPDLAESVVEWAFDRVWRTDFTTPGFAVLDFGQEVSSRGLRALMLDLKNQLSALGRRRGGQGFAYQSLGRYDQQVTTKFHLDGAPDQSLLLLGYEPTPVRSCLSLADHSRAAHDLGLTPRQFLDEFNPMYRSGEERLAASITVVPEPRVGFWRILLINNSLLPFVEGSANSLGVLHRAEILEPDDNAHRVMNSIMLGLDDSETIGANALARFLADDAVLGPIFRAE